MIDTYSVGQVAKSVGISKQTVRSWTDRFAEHLSGTAVPGEGLERRYQSADVEVLASVKHLRGQGVVMTNIMPTIARGDRFPIEPPEPPETPTEATEPPPDTQTKDLAALDLLERFAMPMIDSLQQQLDAERQARLDAEVDAAQLRGRLEEIEGRRPWYRRLFRGD